MCSNDIEKAKNAATDFIERPLDTFLDASLNVGTGSMVGYDSKKGIKTGSVGREISTGVDNVGREIGVGLDYVGREIGNGWKDISGANAYESGMRELARSQREQSDRLLWEQDQNEAKSNETDLQAEARKRTKANMASGRSGTILTGTGPGVGSANILGSGSGSNILGG